MAGLRLLLSSLGTFALLLGFAGALHGGDDAEAATPKTPPKAGVRPVEEDLHGTKVVDKYRWLEDGKSAETQAWVEKEMAYSRSLLDPLPGRQAIHQRLNELLSIGSIGVPRVAGKY